MTAQRQLEYGPQDTKEALACKGGGAEEGHPGYALISLHRWPLAQLSINRATHEARRHLERLASPRQVTRQMTRSRIKSRR